MNREAGVAEQESLRRRLEAELNRLTDEAEARLAEPWRLE